MIDVNRAVKAAVIWTTVVAVACSLFVALFPDTAVSFATMTTHGRLVMQTPDFTLVNAVWNVILWDLLVGAAVWLFAMVYNAQGKK